MAAAAEYEPATFAYYDSPAPLVELAVCRFTVEIFSSSLQDQSKYLTVFQRQIDIWMRDLSSGISESTQNLIKWYHRRISKSALNWLSYHKERVFDNSNGDLLVGACLPELVWRSDGLVDYVKTARALMKITQLSDEQAYKLACLYCMEQEITNLWLRVIPVQNAIFQTSFDNKVSLLTYWNTRMGNPLLLTDKVCTMLPEGHQTFASAEDRLIYSSALDNCAAAEYFMLRLDDQELVSKGCKIITSVKHDQQTEYIRRLVSKFTSQQLGKAFEDHCRDIMCPLVMDRHYTEYALRLWKHVAVADPLALDSFMIRLSAIVSIAFEKPHKLFHHEMDSCEDLRRYIFPVIRDVWNIALNNLQTLPGHHIAISSLAASYVTLKYHMRDVDDYEFVDDIFLPAVLQNDTVCLDKQFMKRYGIPMASTFRPSLVSLFITLCYESDDDRMAFMLYVRSKLNSSEYLLKKFRAKQFDLLEEYLEAYFSDRNLIDEQKRKILDAIEQSNELFSSTEELSREQLQYVRKFIADAFKNDGQAGEKFKHKFLPVYPGLWQADEEPQYEQMDQDGDIDG